MLQDKKNGWQFSPDASRQEHPLLVMIALVQSAFESAPPLMQGSERHPDYRPFCHLSACRILQMRNQYGGLTALHVMGRQVLIDISRSREKPGSLIIDDRPFREVYGKKAVAKRDEIFARAQEILKRLEHVVRPEI